MRRHRPGRPICTSGTPTSCNLRSAGVQGRLQGNPLARWGSSFTVVPQQPPQAAGVLREPLAAGRSAAARPPSRLGAAADNDAHRAAPPCASRRQAPSRAWLTPPPAAGVQVEGCSNELAGLRPFYQRLHICGGWRAAGGGCLGVGCWLLAAWVLAGCFRLVGAGWRGRRAPGPSSSRPQAGPGADA